MFHEGVFTMGKRTNTAKWQESTQRWRIDVQKDSERKSFYSSIPGRTGQREANAKADAWLDEGIRNGNTRVSVLFDQWIEELKLRTSTSHWSLYETFKRNYIIPCIGQKKIGSVTEQHLQEVILFAHKNGNKGAGLSAKTLKDIRDCLSAFIKYARKCKVTTLHPEELFIPKTAAKSTRSTLQPEDIKLLFSCDDTQDHRKAVPEWYIHAFRYELMTGMRPGEVIGLMDQDIKDGVCTIRRAINFHNEITEGKNRNAQRSYYIPEIGLCILEDQKKMLRAAGVISPYVFPTPEGDHAIQQTFLKHWRRYRDCNGISKHSLYELRHTWFSVNKSLPTELVKAMGGHSKDFDTFGVYGHVLPGEAQRTADMVNDAFKNLIK
jgi:integrase